MTSGMINSIKNNCSLKYFRYQIYSWKQQFSMNFKLSREIKDIHRDDARNLLFKEKYKRNLKFTSDLYDDRSAVQTEYYLSLNKWQRSIENIHTRVNVVLFVYSSW